MSIKIPKKVFLSIPVIFLIAGIFILVFFPLQTGSTVWHGYRILIVSLQGDEHKITNLLKKAKIQDYITQENSYIDFSDIPVAMRTYVKNWNQKRSSWFVNHTANQRYIFLKDVRNLDIIIPTALENSGISWQLENRAKHFVPLYFFLSFFIFLCGMLISREKIGVFFMGLPLPFLALSDNRLYGFIASGILQYSLFLLPFFQSSFSLRYSVHQKFLLLKDMKYSVLFFIIAGCIELIGGYRGFLLFLSASTVSVSTGILYRKLTDTIFVFKQRRLHPKFKAFVMYPAALKKKMWNKKTLFITCIVLLSICCGFLMQKFHYTKREKAVERELYIPVPSRYTDETGFDLSGYKQSIAMKTAEDLPDLVDFLIMQWELKTYQWRPIAASLHVPIPGETITYSVFTDTENGILRKQNITMAAFNEKFVKDTLASACTPLEKMLLQQGRFVTAKLCGIQQ